MAHDGSVLVVSPVECKVLLLGVFGELYPCERETQPSAAAPAAEPVAPTGSSSETGKMTTLLPITA